MFEGVKLRFWPGTILFNSSKCKELRIEGSFEGLEMLLCGEITLKTKKLIRRIDLNLWGRSNWISRDKGLNLSVFKRWRCNLSSFEVKGLKLEYPIWLSSSSTPM
jgi:hypothetical protein